MKKSILPVALSAIVLSATPSQAAIIITEVHPTGSSSVYHGDWFEITNSGTSPVDIQGWRMDDNSNSFASSTLMESEHTIGPGKSIVFIAGLGENITSFVNSWGDSHFYSGFTVGIYGPGIDVDLDASGDTVNVYDSTGVLQASVSFGNATLGVTFENPGFLNNATLSTKSVVGLNDAFRSDSGAEVGSPGYAVFVPEVSTSLTMLAGLALVGRRRR